MDSRKASAFILLACLLVPFATCGGFDSDASPEGLRLSRVVPVDAFEGVTITNYGQTQSDLLGLSVCDGEGRIVFVMECILLPGESLSILRSEPGSWFPSGRHLLFDSPVLSVSRFALADDGDQVFLERGGAVLDCIVYGNAETCDGWKGEPLRKIPRYRYAVRTSVFDTDTLNDWHIRTEGATDADMGGGYEASVAPFSFPESRGAPIMDELRSAREEVVLGLYTFDHGGIAYILQELMRRGVAVRILVEGDPAGGFPRGELDLLSALKHDGADIRLMKKSDEGFRRYTYMHAKYAVVDSETSILTSENWTHGSFSSNRGWGAIVRSAECASALKTVFESDSDVGNADIRRFEEAYPTHPPGRLVPAIYESTPTREFVAAVTPVVSPNGSAEAVRELFRGAEERIYSQQLGVQYSWAEKPSENPLTWMCQAAERGIDSRLIVDVSFDDPYDGDLRDGYGVRELMRDSAVEVRCSEGGEGFSMTHNKGMVVDDSVWIGSVNWTQTSLFQNREAAVLIESPDVAEHYSTLFLSDWGPEVGEASLKISVEGTPVDKGGFVLFAEGSGLPEGTMFFWDTDSDGDYDREGMRIAVKFDAGTYDIRVRAIVYDGSFIDARIALHVSPGGGKELMLAAPLLLIAAAVMVIKGMRSISRR